MRLLQDKENLKTRIVYYSSPARLCLADAAPAGGAEDLGLVEGEHGGDAVGVLDQLKNGPEMEKNSLVRQCQILLEIMNTSLCCVWRLFCTFR